MPIAESSNGRTTVSGTVYLGSSPGSAAMIYIETIVITLTSGLIGGFISYYFSQKNENYKWENKARERAQSVAEYLSLAQSLKEDSDEKNYIEANKLSWELAMWLPEKIYKEMINSIVKPDDKTNALTTVTSVRKLILKEKAGNLRAENIAHHAPGIGRRSNK